MKNKGLNREIIESVGALENTLNELRIAAVEHEDLALKANFEKTADKYELCLKILGRVYLSESERYGNAGNLLIKCNEIMQDATKGVTELFGVVENACAAIPASRNWVFFSTGSRLAQDLKQVVKDWRDEHSQRKNYQIKSARKN